MNSEICIVGGGPAGLAAAIALTRSGRQVAVLDCALPPIDKACGEGLMPDSLAMLNQLGVPLRDVGHPLHGIRFFGHRSSLSADFPNGVGVGLRRLALHETLLSHASHLGIRLLWGVKNVHTRPGRVTFSGGHFDTTLIVGADGQQSSIRLEAGLHHILHEKRRYGFRRHYHVNPWSPYVEIYWGPHFQIYITPVATHQVCVALISTNPHLRLDEALPLIPALACRLPAAQIATPEKGSLSLSRTLRRVHSPGYVLLGDASGSVDAITGEGMCLAFRQSHALVQALDGGDLRLYQQLHQRIASKPRQMAALMLLLDRNQVFQRRSLQALSDHPAIFRALLSAHVGHRRLTNVLSWQLIPFGLRVLCA